MKTLILTIVTASVFGAGTLFAGPAAPYGGQHSAAPRVLGKAVAEMKCETMTIAAGDKNGATQVVACKKIATVRAADCRIACARK